MKRMIAGGTAAVAAIAAVGMFATTSAGAAGSMRATLKDVSGKTVGTVTFTKHHDGATMVSADLKPNAHVSRGRFHGFHIHANDLPAAGTGCKASGSDSTKWFTSADGHLKSGAQSHGAHAGDMPSVLVQRDGYAHLMFSTDRIKLKNLKGKAVVLHAGADNYGNIPLDESGSDHTKYMSNGDEGLAKTAQTGNAGDRVACGVIR